VKLNQSIISFIRLRVVVFCNLIRISVKKLGFLINNASSSKILFLVKLLVGKSGNLVNYFFSLGCQTVLFVIK